MDNTARIMTVLPPKEGFSPNNVGAIGLLVRRLAQPEDLIVGKALSDLPFAGVHYLEITKTCNALWNRNKAYRDGVVCLIKKHRPQLIEIHNRPEIALHIARKFPHIPVSLTLHNDPLSMRAIKTSKERQQLLKKVHVVTVSQWLKNRYLFGGVQGEVHVLPNHIDFNEIPDYVPIQHREKTIVFVGRVVADKGADLFVALCQKLLHVDPSWKIEIIGADRFDENNRQTPFIQKLCQQAKHQQIQMCGYMSHPQVLKRISVATAVIMPSRWPEPFGMAALEAMACGTPLLASSVGALPEVVGQGGLLMDPLQLEQAFQQLINLIQDRALQEKLSQNAQEQAFQYNSVKAFQNLTCFRLQICPNLQVNS